MNPEDSAYWWLGTFEGVIANLIRHPRDEHALRTAEDTLTRWEQARDRGLVFHPDREFADDVHEVTG